MFKTDRYTEFIQLGSIVDIQYIGKDLRKTIQLVPAAKANPFEGKLNIACPLCQALLGKATGDSVDFSTPTGIHRILIESVTTPFEEPIPA